MRWHQKEIREVLKELNTSLQGLSPEEARNRLNEYGANELKEGKKKTAFGMLLDQFKDFMIIILIAAAVISGIIGEPSDTIAIFIIVLLNAVIGFVQEYRAEKAMAALKKMAAPTASVIRKGRVNTIPASHLVPGDFVVLDAGSVVPADMRLAEAAQLRIEEAALTGESVPVDKNVNALHDEHLPVGDRKNMAYKGTFVTYGRGTGVVVETGMDTELGKIATMLQEEQEVKTPLQKRLAKFGQKLALSVIAICAIVFGAGMMRGEEPLLMFLTAISLAVAAIPEALPAVVTISLAIGAKKMARQNALIRKLPAVETLGSVTYICSDKTGTLTMNRMSVDEIYVDGRIIKSVAEYGLQDAEKKEIEKLRGYKDEDNPASGHLKSGKGGQRFGTEAPMHSLMLAMALSNDAARDADGNLIGDPTEVALFAAAESVGFDKKRWEESYPRVSELPFDSDRKMMTTFHKAPKGGCVSFTKGGVEAILSRSKNIARTDGIKAAKVDELIKESERMAADGLRVLAIGMRRWDSVPGEIVSDKVENELTMLGFLGIMDPPREEVRESVSLCKNAGIKPVMITGDHPITAMAIARRLGIIDDAGEVITGPHLARLPMEEFEKKVEEISVYARVAPEQKLKIVKALQDRRQFVAMTGDGVNDAPSLKRADIGIAMGITGTDVSKEASHMILLDDNFATIIKAVKEGRRIFDNLRKFIKYTMTSNSGEIWTIFLAPFMGLPIPLLPIHILWINLVTDGLPGLALAVEPEEKEIMKRPPRHPQESIFAHGLAVHILWVGLLMGGMSIITQAWAIGTEHTNWQTMVFTVLCLSQMGHVLAIRSERESLFSQGLLSNRPLIGAVILTFILQMATIYVPFLQPVFKTTALSIGELTLALIFSSIVFFAVEIEKMWKRRNMDKRNA